MPQPDGDAHIQVDTSDDDSLLDSQSVVGSNLTTISSVRDYCYENGRRYHAYRFGQYLMPNDEEEQDRLALLHHTFKLLLGGDLFRAPIQKPQRILDVGTGTGIWALEMAEDFPNAEILGTDLSPIQPSWAPPNCTFLVDDAESDWAFTKDEAFDYIHARSMGGSIGDWGRLLRQAYDHVKPGGWVECQESETWMQSDDGTCKDAVMVRALQQKLEEGSIKFGKRMNIAPEVRGYMQRAGFVNVTDDIYKCPIGTWPKSPRLKEIGRVGKLAVYDSIEPYALALFTRVLGYTYEEARDFVQKVQAELVNSNYHIYVSFHYIYGQRPLHG
ncbi:TAM domain methyltransferase [Aspergillus sclerotiicarbonarius CBS 121057]|uniref:TAM domain methyltransferase n=1 Tax=Aspergillus sclerotiicarbonarius (strain CBS 121057 / IBT 28362) TaxID=1448318 RepID=A0A319E9E8_ASPSB|nr:TAM domain methyltransferase [Aspergillus sclerotiicarbonarius CBS 121057]